MAVSSINPDGIVNLTITSRIQPVPVGDCAFPSATNGGHFHRPSLKLTMPLRLSFRDVEELLAKRGVTLAYETVREWCLKFGQTYANG